MKPITGYIFNLPHKKSDCIGTIVYNEKHTKCATIPVIVLAQDDYTQQQRDHEAQLREAADLLVSDTDTCFAKLHDNGVNLNDAAKRISQILKYLKSIKAVRNDRTRTPSLPL